MKITAAVTESKGAPFELQELTLGDLRPMRCACGSRPAGICHTDLICRDQWLPVPLPAILGHEGAGVVEAVGAAVTKVAPGDRVGMTFNSCGSCRTCQTGKPSYCHQFFEYNFAASRPVDGSSAVSRAGGAGQRPLLRAVVVRDPLGRLGAQRREAARRHRPQRCGSVRLRHPDGRRRGADEPGRARRQQPCRVRHRHGRTVGSPRRRDRGLHDHHRRRRQRRPPRAWRSSSARPTWSTRASATRSRTCVR